MKKTKNISLKIKFLPFHLHHTTPHTTLHYITLHHTTPHYTTPHHTTLQLQLQLQLHYFTLHYTRHYTTLPYPTFHYTTLITPPQMQLQLHYTNYTTPQLQLHYTTTTTTAALHHTTSSSCGWGDRPGDHCNHCNHSRKNTTPATFQIHQWIRSAIRCSQQPSSPIGFLFLKLPPPPCAVLLVIYEPWIQKKCGQATPNIYEAWGPEPYEPYTPQMNEP